MFHSHRLSEAGKYVQPDAANFNSWRRHIRLLGDPPDEIVHSWEDVKAMFNGGTRKRMTGSGLERSVSPMSPMFHQKSGTSSSTPPPPPCKQIKTESATEKSNMEMPPLYDHLGLHHHRKDLHDYLWPRPPQYHLLWPGRPLPSLPITKDTRPGHHDLSETLARGHQEPFFGLFFNNNFTLPSLRERQTSKEEAITQFMDGPFFR